MGACGCLLQDKEKERKRSGLTEGGEIEGVGELARREREMRVV